MRKHDLEHILRASMTISECKTLIVIGSAAILASYSNPPEELSLTREADIFPLDNPARSDLIDAAIGEESYFDLEFGYYAHGVGPETAILPQGWENRLVRLENPNTLGAVGMCLDPHDLAASKLVAGREKDLAFVRAMLRHGLATADVLEGRVRALPLKSQQIEQIVARLRSWEHQPRPS